MHKNIFISLFASICLIFNLQAQETHDVKDGETLYSVSKHYDVTISDLVKANPKAKRGLRKGMSIVIPIIHDSIDTVAYIMHKVKPLESFYSIKNKYGIEQQELLEYNPHLINGFRSGTFIKVPQHDEIDVTEEIKFLGGESTSDIFEELKRRKNKFKKKDSYDVAFMLPLYLDKNDTIEAYQNLNEESSIYKKTRYALDFYSGAKVAIDSLNKAGMSINVHVYDTKNDPHETFDLVVKSEFDKMDLVIGPFYSKNFKIAAEILSRRDVPIVAPLSTKGNLLENIPNAFQVIPTSKRQVSYLSDYISENFSDKNLILVRKSTEQETTFAEWMTSSLDIDSVTYKEVLVEGAVVDSIHHELDSLAEMNVILIPSSEKDFVTDLLTKLNATRDSSILVFGMPEWNNFNDLDFDYLMNLNVHIPNSGVLSYDDDFTQYFVKAYQTLTGNDPSARFAFSGFDVSFYFLNLLNTYGGVSANMYLEPKELLNLNFDYNYKRNEKNGSRNQSVQIIKYEDLEIIRVDK